MGREDLDVPDISGSLAEGKLLAQYRMVSSSEPTFTAAIQASKIQLRSLASEADDRPRQDQANCRAPSISPVIHGPANPSPVKAISNLFRPNSVPWNFWSNSESFCASTNSNCSLLKDAELDLTIGDKRVQVDDSSRNRKT